LIEGKTAVGAAETGLRAVSTAGQDLRPHVVRLYKEIHSKSKISDVKERVPADVQQLEGV